MAMFGGAGAGGWSTGIGGQSMGPRSGRNSDGWDDEYLGKAYDAQVVRRILPYLKPYKLQAAIALFQRGNGLLFRQIAETQPAALAAGIFEIKRLPAVLAFEQLHQGIPGRTLFRAPQQNFKATKTVPSSNSLADSANN